MINSNVYKILFLSIVRFALSIPQSVECSEFESEFTFPFDSSFIPKSERISDIEAQIELAKLIASQPEKRQEAVQTLESLNTTHPDNTKILLALADLYITLESYGKAVQALNSVEQISMNSEVIATCAFAYAKCGYYKKADELIDSISIHKVLNETTLIYIADTYLHIGKWPEAIEVYKHTTKVGKNKLQNYFHLARCYITCEMYFDAEQILKKCFSFSPNHPLVWFEWANLLKHEMAFDEALAACEKAKQNQFPDLQALAQFQASILLEKGNYQEAYAIYDQLSKNNYFHYEANTAKAKILQKTGEKSLAAKSYSEIASHPHQDVISEFYSINPEKRASLTFVNTLIETLNSPQLLFNWAMLYKETFLYKQASKLLEQAYHIDPAFIPALFELAWAQALENNTELCLETLDALIQLFPDTLKFKLYKARFLAWGSRCDASIDVYDELIAKYPDFWPSTLEKARTAYWGKRFSESISTYIQLLHPTVDHQISTQLATYSDVSNIHEPKNIRINAATSSYLYSYYEKLLDTPITHSTTDPKACNVEYILIDNWAKYRLQKATYLEAYGTVLNWNNRPFSALKAYDELIAFAPWTTDALFEKGQIYCSIGQCEQAMAEYKKLLHLNPYHVTAREIYEHEQTLKDPKASYEFAYWRERGFGVIAQMQRIQHTARLTLPYNCQNNIFLERHYYFEKPLYKFHTYRASGKTIGFQSIFNEWVSFTGKITHKFYAHHKFQSTTTGLLGTAIRLQDYGVLDLSFEKVDELYDYFGLKQKTQGKHWRLGLTLNVTPWLDLEGFTKVIRYSDNNTQHHQDLTTFITFYKRKVTGKIILQGEHRNTAHVNEFVYSNGTTSTSSNGSGVPTPPPTPTGTTAQSQKPAKLTNIIYPYWTPHHYWERAFGLEFHIPLTRNDSCGGLSRYINVRGMARNDNTHNRGTEIQATLHYELTNHISLECKAFKSHTRQWKGQGLWFFFDLKF